MQTDLVTYKRVTVLTLFLQATNIYFKRSNSPYLMQNMREKHCHYGYSLHHCLNKIKNFSKQTHTQHYSSKTGFQFLTIRSYHMKNYKCRRWYIQVYNKLILPLKYQKIHRKLYPGCVMLHLLCQTKLNII